MSGYLHFYARHPALSAIADALTQAGNAFHNTVEWQENADWFEGKTPCELVQAAFDAADTALAEVQAEIAGGAHDSANYPDDARVERIPDKAAGLLIAASHALRSYQYGNTATDLAEDVANKIDAHLEATGGRSIYANAGEVSNVACHYGSHDWTPIHGGGQRCVKCKTVTDDAPVVQEQGGRYPQNDLRERLQTFGGKLSEAVLVELDRLWDMLGTAERVARGNRKIISDLCLERDVLRRDAEQPKRRFPEGWSLVPTEPTKRMTCEAFIRATEVAPDGWTLGSSDSQEFFAAIYRHMLKTAPDAVESEVKRP